jgi:hypothetical protein
VVAKGKMESAIAPAQNRVFFICMTDRARPYRLKQRREVQKGRNGFR